MPRSAAERMAAALWARCWISCKSWASPPAFYKTLTELNVFAVQMRYDDELEIVEPD
ncbi:MAG: hypothetical protein R6W06_11265 [Prochlorococcaceae cyanobacterium]